MTIISCTMTGLDRIELVQELNELCCEFPFLEIGILFSAGRAGAENRYPGIATIGSLIERLEAPIALHVCGEDVARTLSNDRGVARSESFLRHTKVGRIQLNLNAARAKWLPSVTEIDAIITEIGKPVIIQDNSANQALNRSLNAPNHQVLFDASGGLGVSPAAWPTPIFGKACGYAGGLGPDTIVTALHQIEAAAGSQPVWIDMENRLRTDDWLDPCKARMVAGAVARHMELAHD